MKKIALKWFNLSEKMRFLVIAIANTLFRYILFVILIELVSPKHEQICLFASWLLSSFSAFFALKYLVFSTIGNHLKEYFKSLLTLANGYFINLLLLLAISQSNDLSVLFNQGIALSLTAIINYFVFKYFAFKTSKN